MDDHIYKQHNKSLLLYHVVCPVRYRRDVITEAVMQTIKETCEGIGKRYEIFTLELGVDEDHVHFLEQSVPTMKPQQMVQTIKSITAKEVFKRHPEVKQKLWGGKFWTSGYYINTVGRYASRDVIEKYVKEQGKNYKQIMKSQPTLFDGLI